MKNKNRNTVATAEQQQPTSTDLVIIPQTTNKDESPETTAEVLEDAPREKQVKSVGEIIAKHQKVSRCLEKRQSIDEAGKTLDSFSLGTSKIKDVLSIKDGRGNLFETSKTDLIEDVISFLKTRVDAKSAEVESELLELENI